VLLLWTERIKKVNCAVKSAGCALGHYSTGLVRNLRPKVIIFLWINHAAAEGYHSLMVPSYEHLSGS